MSITIKEIEAQKQIYGIFYALWKSHPPQKFFFFQRNRKHIVEFSKIKLTKIFTV